MTGRLAVLTLIGTLISAAGSANAALLNSTPYLCFDSTAIAGCGTDESPFVGLSFDYFHLDEIEDDLLNTPGISASAGAPRDRIADAGLIDSVDADDGTIDGSGLGGNSFSLSVPATAPGPIAISFTFDAIALGALPTHAGFVLTDITEGTTVTFEAFDSDGLSLGTLSTSLSSSTQGVTFEDQFFGVIDAGGISALSISSDRDNNGGLEVDHIQYGFQSGPARVPEPGALALFGVGLIGLSYVRRRRHNI